VEKVCGGCVVDVWLTYVCVVDVWLMYVMDESCHIDVW